MTSAILRFSEKPVIDASIQEYEYHEYELQARTNLNRAGEININIELQDFCPSPTKGSMLHFKISEKIGGIALLWK